jgi:drug/metabolite transporter (DMT)-like permease
MTTGTNEKKAYFYAGLTVIFWSTVATAFKIGLGFLSPLQLVLVSSYTSTLILGIILVVQQKQHDIFKARKHDVAQSALVGFLNPFLYYLILFKAYSLLPAQVAQPLNMTWPLVLTFLSVPLLKQKIEAKSYLALFISFTGVLFISSQGEIINYRIKEPEGVFYALISTVVWSLFWIFNLRDKRDEITKLFMGFVFASLYITILYMFIGNWSVFTFPGIMAGMYVGSFEMGFSFVFWLLALKYAKTTGFISNLIYLSPFLSLIFIHFILGEQIFFTTFAGLILIIAGIILQKIRFRKKPRQ